MPFDPEPLKGMATVAEKRPRVKTKPIEKPAAVRRNGLMFAIPRQGGHCRK